MNKQVISKLKESPTIISLIVANIIPIFGVLFLGWGLFNIMFLYWLESAVIGFYHVIKIIVVTKWLSILFVPFFVLHFGIFMIVHLVFIMIFFAAEMDSPSLETSFTLLKLVLVPLIALFISHGVSFFHHFYGKNEIQQTNAAKLMRNPYNRIMLMQFTIVFGGMLIVLFKTPLAGALLLIVLKIIVDVNAHIKEHTGKSLISKLS